jgi:hypothetical protein
MDAPSAEKRSDLPELVKAAGVVGDAADPAPKL